jgi:sulfite dehydrogenase (cytochrome) subunit B
MRHVLPAVAAGLVAAATLAAGAKPIDYAAPSETATFRPGPGVEAAEAHCAVCHSADYVSTQPPHRGRAFWQAEVAKMRKVYGAPIEEGDVAKIVDYLAATY